MSELVGELRARLPGAAVVTEASDIEAYCIDWRGRVSGRPVCVVLPSSTAEVAAVVSACAARGVAIHPQGGNTGLCYGAVPAGDRPSVVISLSRMTKIRALDRAGNSMICEAGTVLTKAHEAAASIGRQLPMHLGSEGSAQIGGLISTNAGGTGVLRYGPMRDLVLGLEVVLADGRVWNGLSMLRKDNTGYDLKHLFIGAEGTLGIVTAAALELFPAMKSRGDAWVAVATPADALTLLGRCQDAFDTRIQAFELLSRSEVNIALTNVPGNRIPFAEAPPWSVLIELGDPDGGATLTAMLEDVLSAAAEDGILLDAVIAQSDAQAQSFWRLRHTLSEANKRHGHHHAQDVSVPVAAVPEFLSRADAWLASRFPEAEPVVVSHLGDGNVHYMAMFTREDWARVPDPAAAVDELQTAIHDIAAGFGGSFSAEHGVGRKLVGELARLTDPVELDLLRTVKKSLDPQGIMNPGVIFPER
ncbi:MAG: FAD-binding protein [Rhizobiales bacterium]|nr:FAD-binding protein [Hyphomicrobiales bacterium]